MTTQHNTAQQRNIIGIYGGTFDPIHNAHIVPVQQAARATGIDKIKLMPCHVPPHKASPKSEPQHRVAMVKRVIQANPIFELDERELKRHKASYTIDTLEEVRKESPNSSIVFFVGTDSILSFTQWHRWQEILDYCHLVVCTRPGFDFDPEANLHPYLKTRLVFDAALLRVKPNGMVYFTQTDEMPISSTLIRQKLASGEDVSTYLPDYILSYIRQHHLYLT